MKNFSIYTSLALLVIAILFFGVGFFFGFKTKVDTSSNEAVIASSSASSSSTSSIATTTTSPATNNTSITDVFWIRVGTNPVCPETHPIKGKFDSSTAKFYYATDNKSYDRVRPDICFTTENFAKDVAGFVKKF